MGINKQKILRSILMRCISSAVSILPDGKISDFLIWPVSKRLFSNYSEIVAIDTNIQMELYGDMPDMVNKSLLFTSSQKALAWEPMTARLVKILTQRVNVAVVAGSHLGYYPFIIAANNPSADIYAFEPNPVNYERFVKNILLNSFSNIYPQSIALGETDSKAEMFFDSGQSSFIDSERTHDGKGVVTIKKLDSFLKGSKRKPDLMIFDAEGYEPHIIKGADDIIRDSKPDIIFEINPKILESDSSSEDEVVKLLSKHGYTFFAIDDNYRSDLSYKPQSLPTLVPLVKFVLNGQPFVNVFATVDREKVIQFFHES